jgi:4-hydroxybenzoate polyprenyltransferase/phosphoserine phosphatase
MEAEVLPPLCIDLDGTLVRSDTLAESVVALLRVNPLALVALPLWLVRGRSYLKRRIAERVTLDVTRLPYNQPLLALLKKERTEGRRLVLVTAADRRTAERVAGYLGLFDEVLASDGELNLKGEAKHEELARRFGVRGYDYAGNSRADLAVWHDARAAIIVNGTAGLARRAGGRVHQILHDRPNPLHVLPRALRVHQWVKNVLIFLPIVTSHQVLNSAVLTAGLVAFLAFSLCASAAYLLNDLLDLDADRRHPTKSARPLACGDLSLAAAIALVPVLLGAGGVLAATLPAAFSLVLGVYVVTTVAYSLLLKHIALADVVTLASLYGLRVLGGFAATGIEISPWLLAFSLFFFLNLAFLKRYSELQGLQVRGEFSEKARDYFPGDLEVVANFGTASGYISVLVFALYTNSERVVPLYASPILLWFICPLQLYWIGRIWLLTHRGEMHDDPVVWAMTDRVSYVVGALVVAILVLASVS